MFDEPQERRWLMVRLSYSAGVYLVVLALVWVFWATAILAAMAAADALIAAGLWPGLPMDFVP